MARNSSLLTVVLLPLFTACGDDIHMSEPLSVDFCEAGSLVENFRSWSAGVSTEEVINDGGERFLRVNSDSTHGIVQYRTCLLPFEFPGFFRIRIRARVRGESFRAGIRLVESPYTSYSTKYVHNPDWMEIEHLVNIDTKPPGKTAIFLNFGKGSYDLKSILVEKVDRNELVSSYKRPSFDMVDYLSFWGFPWGLPAGWSTKGVGIRAGSEGDSLVITSGDAEAQGEETVVSTSPFQTSRPDENHCLSVVCRAKGRWRVELVDDRDRVYNVFRIVGDGNLTNMEERVWLTGLSGAFTIRFAGTGKLQIDRLTVSFPWFFRKPLTRPPAAFLKLRGGEIAEDTRILFEDEEAMVDWEVRDVPLGSMLEFALHDSYGKTSVLAREGLCANGGRGKIIAFPIPGLGVYDLTLDVIGTEGKRLTSTEVVFAKLHRPVGWGRDMPNSPFGIHVSPQPAAIKAVKAAGINWVRLHDAGLECTGWYAVEPEKGKWSFRDASIANYRTNGLSILAQLGTTPTWASHYGNLGYKKMGYFQRYLRPKDAAEFSAYVEKVVGHYKDSISEYFFWNEPWGRYWATADDAVYFKAESAGADYANFQKIAFAAMKKVNPQARFVGFNTNAFDNGDAWSKDVYSGGAWNCSDAVDYHYYSTSLRATRHDTDSVDKAFRSIRSLHPNFDGKMVYMTEGQGNSGGNSAGDDRCSGLYTRIIPWIPPTSRENAKRAEQTCRFVLSLIAEGNSRVFLYGAHAFSALGIIPNYSVLVASDGGPHPEMAAFSQLAFSVEGRRYEGKRNFGGQGVVYRFGKREGEVSDDAILISVGLSREEAERLSKEGRFTDMYGNPFKAEDWFEGTPLYSRK